MQYTGLSRAEVSHLLSVNGYNEILEKKESFIKTIGQKILSPISGMLLLAAVLSFISQKDFDGFFIIVLLVTNLAITFFQEKKADNAIKSLNKHLQTIVSVLRDNKWIRIDSRNIVPNDIIKLSQGNIIPVDGKILEGTDISVNESSLTGESLPKGKELGDEVYSGSFVVTGIITVQVTKTGKNTSFGKTLFSVEQTRKKSILEKDIIRVSQMLSLLSVIAIVFLTSIFIFEKVPLTDILTLDLSLLIAGIPISLPTVMTLIIEFGVIVLAKKQVIVRRISALEELSNVNFLLTDKTGTLTKNSIQIQKIITYDDYSSTDVLAFAYAVSKNDGDNPIDQAIIKKASAENVQKVFTVLEYFPLNLAEKKSSAFLVAGHEKTYVVIGAPQVVEKLCRQSITQKKSFGNDVTDLANHGYRTVAVAIQKEKREEKKMQLVGLFALADTLREDARGVISFLRANGIDSAMVTGDNRAISQEIVNEIGLDDGTVITRDDLQKLGWEHITKDTFLKTGAFSEVLPEDKYQLVKQAKKFFIVAANGDGINDLPAVKAANVGIAVKNAVDALKSTADIVLLTSGIHVIKDAIIEGRKIFARLYTYSVYRISESQRLIITILILGLFYRAYPLTPLQLIILALLNDIPIISLAFDRVKTALKPSAIHVKERLVLSSLYGLVGVMNSLILFFFMSRVLQLPWNMIQTIFFLKLTVSGHMLIFVAHTKERWYRFLPSREVIIATFTTQLIASLLVFSGFLMPTHISLIWIGYIWLWSLFWMQISEIVKSYVV